MKAYLRYELAATWGVISSNSNVVFDRNFTYLITASLENVSLWSLKQAVLVRSFCPPPSQSGKAAGEVTQLAASPTSDHVAVGHSDGTIRLWSLASGVCEATFSGHRGAVTALRFSASGALLASGSQDTDVVVWDVAGEAGLFRLRGHRGQVTDLAFLTAANKLVTASKDALVKVWDLDTQHCCQTVVGHRGEVWTLDVDPSEARLATGSSDAELRLYRIDANGGSAAAEEEGGGEAGAAAAAGAATLVAMGSVRRQTGERAATLRFSAAGTPGGVLLTCQGAGKVVEVYRLRDEAEAAKKLKRRAKRRREKATKQAAKGEGEEAAEAGAEDGLDEVAASDELELVATLRSKHKVRSFAYAAPPPAAARRGGALAALVLGLANNSVELWDVREGGGERALALDGAGHRSDVRALALSSDDALALSGSSAGVKVWNPRTGACLRSVDSGYVLCALFAPGNRHAVVGTKEGALLVIDVSTAAVVASVPAHGGAVWALAALPDGSGFVSGSADHDVKFWEWGLAPADPGAAPAARQLGIAHTRTLKMTDDVLCVRVSPNGRLLAVALLDSTVRVFFADSLKFFLSLYGHKLPVLSMDISSDSSLLATGSADKNMKIWGLDFGDCHRSLFAHNDSVMGVAFVPNTHYVFTAGKDRVVKYWDADKFEQLLALEGHAGEVWCLAVSSLGDYVLTGSHDRSLRRWERSEEPFFVEEEREKRLESLFEADLEAAERAPLGEEGPGEEGAAAPAGRRTLETVSAADSLVEALDLASSEEDRMQEARAAGAKAPPANPLLLGLPPSGYVLRQVGAVRSADLEQALLLLPFTDALRLLGYLVEWLRQGAQVELLCRVSTLLLRLHMAQLVGTPAARGVLVALQGLLRGRVQGLKDVMGFNLAAMDHLQRRLAERGAVAGPAGAADPAAAALPLKRKAAAR